MRLVDKKALIDAIQGAINIMQSHGIDMTCVSVPMAIVKSAPTIDAIPVEWLKGLMLSTEDDVDKVEFAWIMREWQNEQEART